MEKCQYISNVNKPVHIDQLTLICLSKEKDLLALSPKADGVYNEIKNKTNVFQCEYIEKLDLFLVFDCKKFHIKHNNTLINRMNWIRSLHPMASKLQLKLCSSYQQLEALIKQDIELLKTYLNTTHDTLKWYPKSTFLLDMTYDSFLEILDKNIDSYLLYKTDGWVITQSNNVYKYKPKNELTIDILYSNNKWFSKEKELNNIKYDDFKGIDNTIWRCYWDNGVWVPREQRVDKKIPNHQFIINDLEQIHENYVTATELIGKTHSYYYGHNNDKLDVSKEWIDYLNLQRNLFRENIYELCSNKNIKNVLDIGCGKGYLVRLLGNDVNVTGVDIDPFNIYHLKNKLSGPKYKWIWKDINKCEFTGQYDLIVLNNTVHTIDDLDSFMCRINEITHIGTMIYIHFLDKELLDKCKHDIDFIKFIGDEKYEFDLPWRTESIIEKIVSSVSLDHIMKKYSWNLLCDYKTDKNYDLYLPLHKYLVYKK